MHASTTPSGTRYHHNSDFSGDIHIVLPVDQLEIDGNTAHAVIAADDIRSIAGRAAVLTLEETDMTTYQPERGDAVEAWIKRHRDSYGSQVDDAWRVLDDLLDDYREHADTGTPLDREVQGPHEDGR